MFNFTMVMVRELKKFLLSDSYQSLSYKAKFNLLQCS